MKEMSRKFITLDILKGRDIKKRKRERRWCEIKELKELRNCGRIWPILEWCCSKTGSKRMSTKEISNHQISYKNKHRKILSTSYRSEEIFSTYECIKTKEKALKRINCR